MQDKPAITEALLTRHKNGGFTVSTTFARYTGDMPGNHGAYGNLGDALNGLWELFTPHPVTNSQSTDAPAAACAPAPASMADAKHHISNLLMHMATPATTENIAQREFETKAAMAFLASTPD